MKLKRKYFLIAAVLLLLCGLRVSMLSVSSGTRTSAPTQKGYYDYEGVIHWHTSYSGDAWGAYEDIAKVANRQGVDFMIATEHNNFRAYQEHKEGWYGKTLMLVGVEISRWKEGWLLGLNLRDYTNTRLDPTDKVLADVTGQGGMALIAHPKNPRWRWTAKIDPRISGEEILDMSDEWYTAPISDLLSALFYYPFNKRLAWLQLFHREDETLNAWDDITKSRPFVGIYAPDFHQNVQLIGDMGWHFPRVEDVLPIAHDHVITRVPFSGKLPQDKAMLYDSLRRGHVYVAVDLLQDATGFLFTARQGSRTAWMGDALPAGKGTAFNVKLPDTGTLKNVVIHVYHNGVDIAQSADKNYQFRASIPGAYRVEVTTEMPGFWGWGRKIVWIYSNPVYLR